MNMENSKNSQTNDFIEMQDCKFIFEYRDGKYITEQVTPYGKGVDVMSACTLMSVGVLEVLSEYVKINEVSLDKLADLFQYILISSSNQIQNKEEK